MKIHHVNCGTMSPPTLHLVCHVLIVETATGLVLIDAGFGLDDIADPKGRIGPSRRTLRASLDPEETAARHVERLGFARDDVTHIVLTHLDVDHVGGISDFPLAQVHVTAAEVLGAMRSPSWREKMRYRPAQWAHGPKLVEHTPEGESWRGFAAAKQLDEVSPGIVLIPMPGHSRGHAAVAVDTGDKWILHAGDAFFHRGQIDGHSKVPFAYGVEDWMVFYDRKQVRENRARLAELYAKGEPDLDIVCAHDPVLLERSRS